jgi:hypothetical protein
MRQVVLLHIDRRWLPHLVLHSSVLPNLFIAGDDTHETHSLAS